MKYKKGFIFICLILCLFSIASVVASDVNETSIANDYNCEIEVAKQDTIEISNGNNVLESNIPTGTITDLVDIINSGGNEINLTRDYAYDSKIDQDVKLIINKTITLDGKGHDINNSLSISGNNVILKNINFNKAKLSWYGNYGILDNCTVSKYYGATSEGAMSISGSNITIINSIFSSNTVKAYEYGGAITCWGINGKIINSTFINNKNLYYYGGAINWRGINGQILNCTFLDNYAEEFGGAIYGNEKANIQVYDSTFINNYAKKRGGAVNVLFKLDVKNCTFIKNKSPSAPTISGSKSLVNCSLFYMNEAISKDSTNYVCSVGNVVNSIFLNNTARFLFSESSKANYNWYGGTIDNYLIKPKSYNSLDNLLFLDVSHEDLMLFGENNPIQLIFKVWNGSAIIDYDYSKLYGCEFILTSSSGKLDKNQIAPNDVFMLNVSEIGNGSIVAKFLENKFTFNLTCKYPTKIIANESITIFVDQFMNFGNEELCTVLIPSEAGNLTYSTDNETILNVTDTGFYGFNEGIANLIVEFKETDDYAPYKVLVPINVIRYDTEITTNDLISIEYGKSETIDAFLSPNVGSFVYDSDDVNVASVDENGLISSINAGTTNIVVKFEGNRKYKPSNKTILLTVNKIDSSISMDNNFVFSYGDLNTILTNVDGAEGIDAFIFNNPEAIVNVNNNVISLSNINVGNYSLIVNTIPDNNHNAVTTTANITVNKIDSSMVIPEITFDYGSLASIAPIVKGVTSICDVSVINHPEANIIVKNNVFEISNLAIGTYTLTATTIPDGNHNAVSNTTKITVVRPDSSIQFTKEIEFDYGSSDTTTVILNGATGITNVNVIDHPEAIIVVKNNVISVSGLDEGTYALTVSSVPDSNHNAVTNTIKITVRKYDSSIKFSNDLIFDYGASDSTTVILNGASGITNVNVVGHPEAIINIKNDVINVSGLDAGIYTLTATTIPTTSYNAVTGTAKIQVNKVDSTIKFTKDLVFDYSGSDFDFVVLNGAIDMFVSVVNYPNADISCDKSSISLFGLDVGNYKFAISTIPDKNHNAITLKVPFKVIKSNPIITVKKRNGYTASSTLKAIVENGFGNLIDEGWLKFSVGGKSYHVKVRDGVGQINVKLPKAKTYSYKATFISDNFNSKTVSSKITVKQSKAKVSTKKITSIAGDYFTLKAIVKNSAGKKLDEGSIKFSINGKSYKSNVKNGVATKKLKLSNVKTYTYKATFLSKYYKAKVSTSKVVVKKQPVFTIKIGEYSVKISYKDYKKIKRLEGFEYLVKTYDTGKTVDYKIYKDVKQVHTKKKLYSYGTYLTYYINNPDALIAPYGYKFAGKEFVTEDGIEKVYWVYKKITYKKVLVETTQTKVYIMVAADCDGASARLYHKISEYTDRYGSFETKEYTSHYKKIF